MNSGYRAFFMFFCWSGEAKSKRVKAGYSKVRTFLPFL